MLVFCEYRVLPEHREAFLAWVARDRSRWDGVTLAENETQPGVFVELRLAASEEEALQMEKERLEGRSGWREMEPWLKGGADGVRVWRFRPVVQRDVAPPDWPNGSV